MNCFIDDKTEKNLCKNGSWHRRFKLVGATIKTNYNDNVMKWPKSISPLMSYNTKYNKNDKETFEKAEKFINF